MLVMLSGGLDISVGSTVSLTTVLLATWVHGGGWAAMGGISAVMGVAAAIGLANGILIGLIGFGPFIVTLATLSIVEGAALQAAGQGAPSIPAVIANFGYGQVWLLPYPFIAFLVVSIVMSYLLSHRPWGLHLYAVGGSEQNAALSGLRPARMKLVVYAVCGLFAGVGGIMLAGATGGADPLIGQNYALNAITAVVLGGVSLLGGRGNLLGVCGAVGIITVLGNALDLSSVSGELQLLIVGGMLLVAVGLYGRRLGGSNWWDRWVRRDMASVTAGDGC
jgi:ribose transport system permease protein